jgi:hypothetical protein
MDTDGGKRHIGLLALKKAETIRQKEELGRGVIWVSPS